MNKQEFIEKIKGYGAWCTECHDIHGEKDRYVKVAKVRELLEQLDEPQVEKVEVTEEQARLLKEHEGETLFTLLSACESEEEELFARARLFGYTVKSKRWVVKFKDAERDFYFIGWSDIYKTDDNPFVPNGYVEKDKDRVFIFVDKSKAEAVATLVEGSVEEV